MIFQNILKRAGQSINWNGFWMKDRNGSLPDGSELSSQNSIPLRVTSKVEEFDFGSITRSTDSGTETMYLLKIEDQFGGEFQFLLGECRDYHRETEEEASKLFFSFLELVGYNG
jgi:hypothetical protein